MLLCSLEKNECVKDKCLLNITTLSFLLQNKCQASVHKHAGKRKYDWMTE